MRALDPPPWLAAGGVEGMVICSSATAFVFGEAGDVGMGLQGTGRPRVCGYAGPDVRTVGQGMVSPAPCQGGPAFGPQGVGPPLTKWRGGADQAADPRLPERSALRGTSYKLEAPF